jgi:hypothetical protein
MARWRMLGINFDYKHLGDLLRRVFEHPDAEIAGVFDPLRECMENAIHSAAAKRTLELIV